MKSLITILCAFVAMQFTMTAQDRVKEKDLEGVWILKIDIKDEINEELEDEDNAFARAILKGVSSFVGGILDEIDIQFEFMTNNEVKVTTYAFGEKDVEYTDWWINKDGELEIGDTDIYDDDDDTVWLMDDDVLLAYDKDDRNRRRPEKNVYMVKVD